MSSVYAQEEGGGKRHLVVLECDGCGARIKPHPEISHSGWVVRGWDNGPGTEKHAVDLCPACAQERA